MSNILKGLQLNELSNEKLGQYKKAAGADASTADSEGDYKRGDKRMSGIIKATKKQFANDEKQLKEFAPVGGDDREPDEEEILRQLAAKWWLGTEQEMSKAQKTLAAMGWEIGQDESGDDDAGVFVIRAGDENGDTYIAFNHSDLEELNEAFNNYHANRTGFSRGQRDDERHDLDTPTQVWGLKINGKVWSKGGVDVTFKTKEAALNIRNSILKNRPDLEIGLVTRSGVAEDQLDELKCWSGYHRVAGTKAGFPGSCAKNKTNEEQHSCPHCGGEMVSEELMNEKKDACYYKVKSRYKVWPSAYASGALVKCRKKGADSWGNGGKKNESSILEGLEKADESLHDWFNKEKWVRMDTKGNIKGPCAKEPGEGKPKCLPQAKAHSLGKKGRASAAQRKRREDPNPERSGKAINVNTKKKSNEDVLDEKWSQKYKDSINCSNPKGFSQKAHCQGKNK